MTFEELMQKRNVTIYRLSKESAVPKTTLFDIATGKSNLLDCSGRNLLKISKALNVSIEQLLSLKQAPYNAAYERNIPMFLADGITNLKKARKTNSSIMDCYNDELNSSINVCEIENLISKEQAAYLREKYLY